MIGFRLMFYLQPLQRPLEDGQGEEKIHEVLRVVEEVRERVPLNDNRGVVHPHVTGRGPVLNPADPSPALKRVEPVHIPAWKQLGRPSILAPRIK